MHNLLQYGSDSDSEEDNEVTQDSDNPSSALRYKNRSSKDFDADAQYIKKLQIDDDEKIGEPVSTKDIVPPLSLEGQGENKSKQNNESMDEELIGPPIQHSRNDDDDEELIGPPVPQHILQATVEQQDSSNKSDDEELIGPPVPEHILQATAEQEDSGNKSDDEELIGPPVPRNILESKDNKMDQDFNPRVIMGPPVGPPPHSKTKITHKDDDSDEDSSGSSSGDDEEETFKDIPIIDNVSLIHGNKPVVAIAIDSSGSRLATGSVDYDIRFWDFAGMDRTLQSFRTLTPCGSNPIKCLDYSSTGDAVLVISGMSQAKVLDRDGHEIMECVKGDQYVTDMARTKGHIAPLTSGCWHPRTKEEFLTSSEDSTCRIWDVKEQNKHKGIMKCRAKNGLKTSPISCAYSRDGNLIACSCLDGSIQMWDHRRMFVNTAYLVREAHEYGSETSCIAFSYASTLLATRGGDNTLKLWDLKSFKKPIHTVNNLYSRYNTTNCMFSPNDSLLVTGVSVDKGETDGKMLFFDTKNFNLVREEVVTNSHVIRTLWHPRLQQIFVGCGNGEVKAYFGEKSGRGAQLASTKVRRKKKQVEVIAAQQIITPHALPMFRQDRPKSLRKQMEKDRLDPLKSRRPDLPIKSGQGGRVAASGSTLSSYVIRNLGLSKRIDDDQDPREAILRYAKEAEENPYWISPAYVKTQPKTIFQNDAEDSSEPDAKKQKL